MLILKDEDQYLINYIHAENFVQRAKYWPRGDNVEKLYARLGQEPIFSDEIAAEQRMRIRHNLGEKGTS